LKDGRCNGETVVFQKSKMALATIFHKYLNRHNSVSIRDRDTVFDSKTAFSEMADVTVKLNPR